MSERLNSQSAKERQKPLTFSYEQNEEMADGISQAIDNLRFSALPDKEFYQSKGIALEDSPCRGADFTCQLEADRLVSAHFKLAYHRSASAEILKLDEDKSGWSLVGSGIDGRQIAHDEVVSLFYEGLDRSDFPAELLDSNPDGETVARTLNDYFAKVSSNVTHKRSYYYNEYMIGDDYLYETNSRLEYSENSHGDSGQLFEVSTPIELGDGSKIRKSYQYFISSKIGSEDNAGGRMTLTGNHPQLDYFADHDGGEQASETMLRVLQNLQAEKLTIDNR